MFGKHLKKIVLVIVIPAGGWFGIQTADVTLQDTADVVVRVSVDTADATTPEEIAYYITLNPDPAVDNTQSLQAQLDSIPDGKLLYEGDTDILKAIIPSEDPNFWRFEERGPSNIQYVDIYLPKGRFWTEGESKANIDPDNSKKIEGSWVIMLRNRKYLRLHAEGTTLYTKAPGIPYKSDDPGYADIPPKNYLWKGLYSHRRHLSIKGSESIIINGLRIEGSNYTEGKLIGRSPENTPPFWTEGTTLGGSLAGYPGYVAHWEFEHGFNIVGSRNITLNNCEVDSVWGDGFYLGESHNVIFKDCRVRFNGRMAWATAGASNILIDGLYVNYSRMSGIDFENDHPESIIKNVEVRNSKFEFIQLMGIPAEGVGDVSNIYIHHNDLGWDAISCKTLRPQDGIIRKNWRIEDNTNVGDMKLMWMDNLAINRNVIDSKYAWPIRVTAVRNFEAKENNFLRGKGIKTALCGAASYEPYSSEKWVVEKNTPQPVVFDESDKTTEAGKLLYEQMKQNDL